MNNQTYDTVISNAIFKEQIREDINLIKERMSWDSLTRKDEYAFNYWILSNIYSMEEELCRNNITEYSDKGIDCYVHYEEDKELYIIQNKYYGDTTPMKSQDLSDFLTRPLASLEKGNYKNNDLQKVYDASKEDSEYKIFLHFYITNNIKINDVENLIAHHKSTEKTTSIDVFYLDDIHEKYYGKQYKKNHKLFFSFAKLNKAACLAIRPDEYNLPNMSEAYYAMTKVTDIYRLWKKSNDDDYPLFEENIREYLGKNSGINKSIIDTLKDPNKRGNFFYYNNGITIICDSASAETKKISVSNPQIVNGCQTVNSIAEVIRHNKDHENEFDNTYVMTKILVVKDKTETTDGDEESFYRKIVRYANSQNSINEKAFGATLKPFFKIQEGLKQLGFLVTVKQSDGYQFKNEYIDVEKKGKLLELTNKHVNPEFHIFKKITDIKISLETLIQIIGAFEKDAHFSYVRKSRLLKPNSKEYQEFSTKIHELFTTAGMGKLIVLYKKSEHDKRNSEDKRTPQPYYLLNFLGNYLARKKLNKKEFMRKLTVDNLICVYNGFKSLSSKYYEEYRIKHNVEYNKMLNRQVDKDIINSLTSQHFSSMEEFNITEYKKIMSVFN